jgi:putative addiction module component (TIGR02574 family)
MSVEPELIDRVLLLPVGERAALARKIILSLEPTDFDSDSEAAWDAEIEARLAQVDRGEVVLIDWRESIERARRSLAHPEQE